MTADPSQRVLGRVAALGPHIVDVLGRPVSAIPAGQGGAVLEEIRMTVAGTGGGVAVDLAKLGWQVGSYGAVGADGLADYLRTTLTAYGVDTTGLVTVPGVQTSATILPIRPNGERPALHVGGATASLRVVDLDRATLATSEAVLLGGPETMPALLGAAGIALVHGLRQAGVLVFVDLLHADGTTLDSLDDLLPLVDWLMPNDDQLRVLTGLDDLGEAARVLLDRGVGGVAVTVGEAGALLVRPGEPDLLVPSFPTTVVDTTGCGDAFDSGMLTAIVVGCTPEDAVLLGCACGSLVATGLGSDAGIEDLAGVLAVVATRDPEAADRIGARIESRLTARVRR